ncbi:OPI10 family protein [Aspergillus saccharolyticus JOP 1030-1]|uniref:DUF775-domain-containing protein n=1 Tax=Aspergillus saccharolyticus JOP 1030-1 TaxID=1450539 RepID=A0A318ZRW6_9EURO|nr:DUF775-domain-containing protein [Aspergillus saccharolyticus JOP 1030-1]PYH42828.1 DUF775-domain-containing protein [Aspergillus saccharolyticus JOP 1030-1]
MFSVIIPGRPCLTDIVPVDGQPNGQPTKFAFTFPHTPAFDELVVFFLPGTVLPPDTAAAIYLQFPTAQNAPGASQFRFIGALANERPSAIFKVRPPPPETISSLSSAMVTLGISIEPVQAVAPQLAALEAEDQSAGSSSDASGAMSMALTPVRAQQKQISTKVLAQRIIGNAFNFLASFASSDKGQDVVPLKSFQDWWRKFERRVEMDPSFLEREDPGATG